MLWESQGRRNVLVLNGLTRGAKTYALTKTLTVPAGKSAALEFVAACDSKSDGWRISVKADGKDLGGTTVNKATMKDGWTQIKAALPNGEGRPLAVEVTMEPATPPAERRGPPALSLTVPQLTVR